jgi:hypothetical protein
MRREQEGGGNRNEEAGKNRVARRKTGRKETKMEADE